MILKYNYNSILLSSEDEQEITFLKNSKLHTKLAYNINQTNIGHNIYTSKKNFIINNNFSHIPICNKDELGYCLRMIIDNYLVNQYNTLPLHVGLCKYRNILIFLFANSNGGKSSILNELSKKKSTIKIIGDDHIIFSKKAIFGNNIMRLRSKKGDKLISHRKNIIKNIKKYKLINIDLNNKNFKKLETNNDFYKKTHYSALKYINNTFTLNNKYISLNKNTKSKYKRRFVQFIKNSNKILSIFGKKDFIISNILKELKI